MSGTIEISEHNLKHNVAAARAILGEIDLLAVIKADAYGHSATLTAPMLARARVPWLGVTDAREGAAVRAALAPTGLAPRILIMTAPPGSPAEAAEAATLAILHHLTPIVDAESQLHPLAEAAAATPHTLPFHLEIDSGMSRQGAAPGPALEAILTTLTRLPTLRLDGVCTHLASAECTDATQNRQQLDRFQQAICAVHQARLTPPWLHLGNASTLDNGSPAAAPTLTRLAQLARETNATPMARCGLGLYGLTLPLDPDTPGEARLHPYLHPILTWRTTITSIHEVPAGARIGYNATYTAPTPMRLALVPVGYADGLRRALSSTNQHPGGWFMIQGQRAPIVGRISMNLTTVDITNISPTPQPGTPVTLLGPGITAQDHARLAQCIPYEILCGLRGRFAAADDHDHAIA